MYTNIMKICGGIVVTALFLVPSHGVSAVPEASTIKIDGSSTVFPITEAVAEEFQLANKGVKVTVGISGTGGGFKKFIAGETDISNASRPIKQAEIDQAKEKGVGYVELPIAYDALTVVVHPKNTWVDKLTVAELKKIWEPEAQGKIMTWDQVRPTWPKKPIVLFGAGTDSGTFDYFTEAVVGKEDMSRGDYTATEDDNVIVQGVSDNEGALGYFGLAYYESNKTKVRAVPIDAEKGKGAVQPDAQTVIAGIYAPLSRPLFIYVSAKALDRPEIKGFVDFYSKNAGTLATEVGYISLPAKVYELAQVRLQKRVAGSMFEGKGHQIGASLQSLLEASQGT